MDTEPEPGLRSRAELGATQAQINVILFRQQDYKDTQTQGHAFRAYMHVLVRTCLGLPDLPDIPANEETQLSNK